MLKHENKPEIVVYKAPWYL